MKNKLHMVFGVVLILGLAAICFAAPIGVESGGVPKLPGVEVTSSAVPLNGLYLPAANNPSISSNGVEAFRFPISMGASTNVLTSAGAGAVPTWGTAPVTSSGATFGGDVNATAYPINTAWAAFVPFVAGTARKLCWTVETVGTGVGTILGTLYDETGTANVGTVTITCNNAQGTVTCGDISGALAATRTYDMRWTTDGCTLRPAGELTMTYTTP